MGRPVTMKRPSETTAHNKSEKTAEFSIPDLTLIKSDSHNVIPSMADAPPAVAKMLKARQEAVGQIDQAIADVKKDTARRMEESTVVFNLRQLEMEDKMRELEEKKERMEREVNELLATKNSKFHEDLKTATETLLDETKKIAGLDQVVDSLQKVRLEMIRLFNQGLEDRRSNIEEITNTKVEILKLQGLVQETVGDLSLAYRDILSASKRTLNDYESDSVRVLMVKQDLSQATQDKEQVAREHELLKASVATQQETLNNLQQEIQYKKTVFDVQAKHIVEQDDQHQKQTAKIQSCQEELTKIEEAIKTQRSVMMQTQVECETLKVSFEVLQGTYQRKQNALTQMDEELRGYNERAESMRKSEVELLRAVANLEMAKATVASDVAMLQGQKEGLQNVYNEMKRWQTVQEQEFADKKASFAQQMQMEEERHQHDLQQKIQEWELQFSEHCVSRKANLNQELIEMTHAHNASLMQIESEFISAAKSSIIDILDTREFANRGDRVKAIQMAFDVATTKLSRTPFKWRVQFWQRGVWCTGFAMMVVAGLLIWKW